MLILKNIIKEYNVADTKVAALKGINIAFRKNEFVIFMVLLDIMELVKQLH